MDYLVLIILWTLWCTIHSGMISLTVNRCLKNRSGSYYKYYRLFYNLVALITIVPVILYSLSLKSPVLFRWEGYMIIFQIALFIIVVALFISGGLKYDLLQFLGIKQIQSGESQVTLSQSGDIDTSGILSFTRHPWYLAAIIFVWIVHREISVSTLIVNIVLTIYLVIGTILEEKKLIIELGDQYRNYIERVSMLFPAKWIFAKLLKLNHTNSTNR
ncbi:MAG: hypothetical protein KJO61_14020 [Deltaproteobacteria bacterium]|nr:hypothetical protein [Deltaproteobacteria bacterium]